MAWFLNPFGRGRSAAQANAEAAALLNNVPLADAANPAATVPAAGPTGTDGAAPAGAPTASATPKPPPAPTPAATPAADGGGPAGAVAGLAPLFAVTTVTTNATDVPPPPAAGAQPPASPTPATSPVPAASFPQGAGDPRAEVARMAARFGDAFAARAFAQGMSYEAALDQHARALEARVADQEKRLASLGESGEKNPPRANVPAKDTAAAVPPLRPEVSAFAAFLGGEDPSTAGQ